MASPGYSSTLKVSGAATAMSGEACTDLGGDVWQITTAAHRIVDPTQAVVVYDDATPLAAGTDYDFDYLTGKITLAAPAGGTITVDGYWLAMLAVAEVRKATLQGSRAQLEDTSFDSGGDRSFKNGLAEWSGQAEMFSQPTDDLDSGTGGSQSFFDFLNDGSAKLIEVYRAGKFWRGWAVIESIENVSERDGLVSAVVGYRGSPLGAGASIGFEEL